MVVRGRFAVPTQTSSFSFFFERSKKSYMGLDGPKIMPYHDINHVHVENKIKL